LEQSGSIGGRIMVIIFFIIWIAIAMTMGFSFIDFANSWPDWAPGPHPSLFIWVPFAFAGFGVLFLLFIIVGWLGKPRRKGSIQGYPVGATPYDEMPSSSTETSGYREPTLSYEIEPFCSQCGARLDSELVEWVGPLNYRCPSCGHTHKAKTRYL
jgi:DNA-directed RNA polymerase subunit RPC12/RpoP